MKPNHSWKLTFHLLYGGGLLALGLLYILPLQARGGLRAERPRNVPAGALYHEKTRVWYLDKEGKRTVWFADGILKARGPYRGGKREGQWVFNESTGKIKARGTFRGGRMEGGWKFYDSSGVLRSEGSFQNNQREGRWVFYNARGVKKSEGDYLRGRKDRAWTEYYGNGRVFYRGRYRGNLETGKWSYFTRGGKLIQQGAYRRGARVGSWYICVLGQCGYKTFKMSETPRASGRLGPDGDRAAEKNVNEFLHTIDRGSSPGRWR